MPIGRRRGRIAPPRGITLIELLLSVVLVVSVVIVLSLFFPKASKSLITSRQRLLATNMAQSRLFELTKSPFTLVPLTSPLSAYFPGGTCDCSNADFAALPVDAVHTHGNVNYRVQHCINQVERTGPGTFNPHCPPDVTIPDTGMKNVLVRVSWTVQTETYTTEVRSVVSR